jgi:hypothetical protein
MSISGIGIGSSGSAYRDGRILVVPSGCSLPLNCVKCGAPAAFRLSKTFRWRDFSDIALAIFSPPLIRTVGEKTRIGVPLCDTHRSWYSRMNTIGTTLWMGSLLIGLFLIAIKVDPLAIFIVPIAVASLGLAVLAIRHRSFYPVYIDEDYAKFKGAGEKFLSLLPSSPTSSAESHLLPRR